ncbi:MAG: symmetrical bis(5'-nucleosyl)-tetraphosphatase [Gammaproteobacteria bacterium]
MAVYAIGDIQGCYDDLQRLLDKLNFNPSKDILWFAGDLVNRGPKSIEVLRFVKELGDSAITVLGNHDLHLLAVTHGVVSARPNDTFEEILAAPDRDVLLDWLRRLPLIHHDESLCYTMVHAGLPPQWDLKTARANAAEVEAILRSDDYLALLERMYGNEPAQWSNDLAGWDRLRFIINCFTRMRFCNDQGQLTLKQKGEPGTQPKGFKPWFEVQNRANSDLNIIFGHWSTLGHKGIEGVYALDSGCVWGGRLTALRIDVERAWISIPCSGACIPGED